MPTGFRHIARLLLCFVIMAGPFVPQRAGAEPYQCEPYQEPQISIQPIWVTEQYNADFSLDEIRRLAGQPNVETAGGREVPIGLTIASLKLDSSFEVVTETRSDDPLVCTQIKRFDMQMGFDDVKVYLAREIPYNSCGYFQVLEHERHHIAIDRSIVNFYLPQLQALVAGELRQIGVVRANSAAEAEAYIRRLMNDYLRDLGVSIASVREQQQRQFDSHEEYQRLSRACNGELSGLISRAMQRF